MVLVDFVEKHIEEREDECADEKDEADGRHGLNRLPLTICIELATTARFPDANMLTTILEPRGSGITNNVDYSPYYNAAKRSTTGCCMHVHFMHVGSVVCR